jgi:hypothetical protein
MAPWQAIGHPLSLFLTRLSLGRNSTTFFFVHGSFFCWLSFFVQKIYYGPVDYSAINKNAICQMNCADIEANNGLLLLLLLHLFYIHNTCDNWYYVINTVLTRDE